MATFCKRLRFAASVAALALALSHPALAQQRVSLDRVTVVLNLPDDWTELEPAFSPQGTAQRFSAASSDRHHVVSVYRPAGVGDESALRAYMEKLANSAGEEGYEVESSGPYQAEGVSDEVGEEHWRGFLRVSGEDYTSYTMVALQGAQAVVVGIGGVGDVAEASYFAMLDRIEWPL